MENNTTAQGEPELTTSSWLELATEFWKEVSKIINASPSAPDPTGPPSSEKNSESHEYRTYESWKTGLKNLNSFIQMLTRPENQESVSEAMVIFFDYLTQITGDSSENLLEFQKQILNSLSTIGKHTKAYSFDDLDQRIFQSFRQLYETEFQKYYYIPKLGLPRFHLERISVLIDKLQIYHSYLSELIHLFFVPLEKTNRNMQARIDELIKHKDFVTDSDAVYNEWVKMLEGHYMKLLQSPEYNDVLKKTIDSLADFRKSEDDVLCMILKRLPIPTNKEMDDVYKELYDVKKQVKALASQLNQMNRPSDQTT